MLRLGGGWTVETLQAAMKSREFLRWMYVLEKEDREELKRTEKWEWYLARMMLIFTASKVRENDAKKLKLEDFLLDFGNNPGKKKQRPLQTWQEQKLAMTAAFKTMGGKKKDGSEVKLDGVRNTRA